MFDQVIHIQQIDSTNNYLKQLSSGNTLEEGTVVWTDFQSAGRGQRGNGWESEVGENLLFSIILYPDMVDAGEQFILSQTVSLAVVDCLKKHTSDITIKWPNDIYWREKKICGILIENTLLDNRIGQCVAGIGININQAEFRSNAPNPVSLKQITHKYYDITSLLKDIVDNIYAYYQHVKSGDHISIAERYKKSLFRNDGYHLYNDGKIDFLARIKDIELSGLLVLETKEGIERCFAFKEIKYIL